MPQATPLNSNSIVRLGLGWLLLTLPLWLALWFLPAPFSIEIFDALSPALDYAVRHGFGLGSTLLSTTGPLGALLTNVHSGQPLWLNYWCQCLVALGFALSLAWTVMRLTSPLRWWLLGALLVVAGYRAEYLHLSLLLISGLTIICRPIHQLESAAIGFILGLLALIRVDYAWFGFVIIAASHANPSSIKAKSASLYPGIMFVVVIVGGWLWSAQRLQDLLPWLCNSSGLIPLRHQAAGLPWTGPILAWGLITGILAGGLLVATAFRIPRRLRAHALAAAGFVFMLLLHLWRQSTGQPEVGPPFFFVAVLFAGLAWLALGPEAPPTRHLRWGTGSVVITAVLGLLAIEPRIFTESIILLNQKLVANVTALVDRRGWQRGLNASFKSSANLFALPRIQAATAGQPTDFLGNTIGYALVNKTAYAPRPSLQSYRSGRPEIAARDAQYYSGPTAPSFVVQRLQAFDRGLPAMEGALAQLALYAHYDFQFEENGFVLWSRRPEASAPTRLNSPIWSGTSTWAQSIPLPIQTDRAYWITIQTTHSFIGWLKNELGPPAEPTLLLRDADGGVLSYRSHPTNLKTGFLITPLFRGEIDLIRYQAGEGLPPIKEITLMPPLGREEDFTSAVTVTLHEVAPPIISRRQESAAHLAQRFRIANRLPVALAAYFPPQTTTIDQQEVLLAHPDSSLEFTLHAHDRQFRGHFGLLDGAYENGNATDGVDFEIEHVPANGRPRILWRRHLAPLTQAQDRGPQKFIIELPQPASGRLILRTQNRPGDNAAWDWCYWTNLRFESSSDIH